MVGRVLSLLALLLMGSAANAQAPAPSSPPNPSFNLLNQSRNMINEVYASPAGMTNWGRDKLGDNTVAPGGKAAIRLPADGNCIYDVRVVYANGQADERRAINTCNVDDVVFPSPSGAGAGTRQTANDPSFRLVNRGRVEIHEVYASPSGARNWGSDQLGDDTVPPGTTHVIQLPAGQCIYDVRVVYENAQSTERRRINLCTIQDLRVP